MAAPEKNEGKFTIKKITPLVEIDEKTVLPESDLCFQDEENIYQFSFESSKEDRKVKIKPGTFVITEEGGSLNIKHFEMRSKELLTSAMSAQAIMCESDVFFNGLDIYEELGEPMVRKLLLYSGPGMGKTATITHYCNQAIVQDPGTVVIVWPTSSIESDWVLEFMSRRVTYDKKCTRMILVMEDIGGGERENQGESRGVDSALLDLLDGLRKVFELPTLIIATTNYPQNLLSALADRPGRFDLMLEIDPPTPDERVELVKFIAKRDVTDEEKVAIKSSAINSFSIAHLKEVVIRSRLHRRSIPTVITEILDHKKRFNNSFEKKTKSAVGLGRSEDL